MFYHIFCRVLSFFYFRLVPADKAEAVNGREVRTKENVHHRDCS